MKDKVVLVTGASAGIGAATALRMAEEGAHVALVARRRAELEDVAGQVRALGVEAMVHVVNVSDLDAYVAAIEATARQFGRLDAIVNNAMHDLSGPIADITLETWRDAFRINADALLVSAQAAFRLMPANGGGAIVNVSSTCGMKALEGMASYSASKAAGQHFSAIAAMEGKPYGVRVNSVVPGFVRTAAAEGWATHSPELLKAIEDGNPMGRMGEPRELADAILFLCSDEASYVNGAALPVDGGHLMRINTPG